MTEGSRFFRDPDAALPDAPDMALADRYATLREVLRRAYEQAVAGKGAERHAEGRAWEDQPIRVISKEVGYGFPVGQAMKKTSEAAGMLRRGQPTYAVHELLGAIVYLAAAIQAIEETR